MALAAERPVVTLGAYAGCSDAVRRMRLVPAGGMRHVDVMAGVTELLLVAILAALFSSDRRSSVDFEPFRRVAFGLASLMAFFAFSFRNNQFAVLARSRMTVPAKDAVFHMFPVLVG